MELTFWVVFSSSDHVHRLITQPFGDQNMYVQAWSPWSRELLMVIEPIPCVLICGLSLRDPKLSSAKWTYLSEIDDR